jgi:hypothetical protein
MPADQPRTLTVGCKELPSGVAEGEVDVDVDIDLDIL